MPLIDKKNILPELLNLKNVILDIGCGPGKKNPDWIGIDALNYDCVDIVGDVFEILEKFPDDSVDEIHSYHFFEHIPEIPKILGILSRIIKKNRKIIIVVPHFSNPYYYSDYTHKNFFGLYSLSYLSKDKIFKRRVPNYNFATTLTLINVKLIFLSPFWIKRPLRKLYQFIFNLSNSTKEFYEESCCYIFPCYEIKYILTKA